MRHGQFKPFPPSAGNRFGNNPKEQALYAEFQAALGNCQTSATQVTEVFIDYIGKYERNKLSIRNLIKTGLSERFQERLEACTIPQASEELVRLLLDDICKDRNQHSNPSIFFKFIGVNNLTVLTEQALDRVLRVSLGRLNSYISCDKNIFYLILKVIKSRCRSDAMTDQQTRFIHQSILNSFFLYFIEFDNEKFRKDNEVIKNFISHFKIFNLLEDCRLFEDLEPGLQDAAIQIALCTLFFGSSMEGRIFASMRGLTKLLGERLQPRKNTFYFDRSVAPYRGKLSSSKRRGVGQRGLVLLRLQQLRSAGTAARRDS